MRKGLRTRITAGLAAAGCLLLLPAAAGAAGISARMKEKYDPIIRSIAAEYGIKDEFVHAVIKTESAYNRYAISKAGAQGLMQLMPATAAAYGVKDVFDPEDNVRGGVKFLKHLIETYGHDDLDKILAAYNAGQTAVKKHGGIPPYPETKRYIKKVKASFNNTTTSARTKIYEYRDESGRIRQTNDFRTAAQYGIINPD